MILLDRFKIPLKSTHKDFDGTLDQTGICPVFKGLRPPAGSQRMSSKKSRTRHRIAWIGSI